MRISQYSFDRKIKSNATRRFWYVKFTRERRAELFRYLDHILYFICKPRQTRNERRDGPAVPKRHFSINKETCISFILSIGTFNWYKHQFGSYILDFNNSLKCISCNTCIMLTKSIARIIGKARMTLRVAGI